MEFNIDRGKLEKYLDRWRVEDLEAREIRRRMADWKYIEKQPEPIRTALVTLVEIGDLWVAAKIAGLSLGEFNEIRLKAKIPLVVT